MKGMRIWMTTLAICTMLWIAPAVHAAEGKPVNLNTATVSELTTIKGIGNVKAQAIIDYREKNGPFRTVDDLKNVSGIGEKMMTNLRPQVTVGDTAAVAPQPAAPSSKQ